MNLLRLVFRLLLGRRLPRTRGRLAVSGLFGAVRLHRDRHGVALIEADDPRDGPFAIGFCHAQDRRFQLELLQRIARGTLAELVGGAAVPVDRLARRIGFHRAAATQWEVIEADVRQTLEAYSRGVQAGTTVGSAAVPHELALLGGRPTPWTPLDTLAVTKVLSFTLAANWDSELTRLKVLTADGAEALRLVDAVYPEEHPVVSAVGMKAGAAVDRLMADLSAFGAWLRPGGASNNWAIAGTRTASGRPLLANDPHLEARLPVPWYLACLRTPTEAVAGASFVGGPVWLAGHNGHAAWGLTAGMADNTDLFLEQVGADGSSIRQGDGFVPCPVLDEVIAVKGGEAIRERVLLTPRGPIIGPALAETTEALSLRATWLDPLPLTGFFRFHQVRSFGEFRRAFTDWPVSSQNLAYADTSGTIGWQLIGRLPRRRAGHGTLPLPGWLPEVGWEPDPVPFDEMPHGQDPPEGFVATANTPPLPVGQGPFLSVDFIDGYRLTAIQQALASRRDWDVAACQQLQMSQLALAWYEIRDAVLAAPGDDAPLRRARDLLAAWDGVASVDSAAASVYELFLVEMQHRVLRARAPHSWRWLVGQGLTPLTPYNFTCFRRTGHLARLLREQPADWFARPWPQEIADVLRQVVTLLERNQGSDPARWGWGALRPLLMHHPLSRKPGLLGRALGRIFNLGPVPCGGDADVINQAAVLPLHPLASSDNIASLRVVFDVGAWHNSRFVLPGGQSGNPLSPHYGDLFVLWQRGEGVPIAFTADEMRAAAVATLDLTPAAG